MRSRIGQAGRLSEKRLVKTLAAKARPNSGALPGAKGDFEAGKTLVEAKSTTARSMVLRHAWLSKIAKEARDVGRTPALTISFTTGDGRPVPNGQWVCIPLYEWQFLAGCDQQASQQLLTDE